MNDEHPHAISIIDNLISLKEKEFPGSAHPIGTMLMHEEPARPKYNRER